VTPLLVNLELHPVHGDGFEVVGPVRWPWSLPRPDDVITYGSPTRRASVSFVRFDLGSEQVTIVCERWPGE
jgi:hypothetical protein